MERSWYRRNECYGILPTQAGLDSKSDRVEIFSLFAALPRKVTPHLLIDSYTMAHSFFLVQGIIGQSIFAFDSF